MNPELKVGVPAMIVGCKHPENSWLIGKVVVVEALFQIGEVLSDEFRSELMKKTPPEARAPFTLDVAVVSGCQVNENMLVNHCVVAQSHLMPLPPLDDDAKLLDTEIPKETEKC